MLFNLSCAAHRPTGKRAGNTETFIVDLRDTRFVGIKPDGADLFVCGWMMEQEIIRFTCIEYSVFMNSLLKLQESDLSVKK